MSLISCSECGKEISDKAASCPSCGAPIYVAAPVEYTEAENDKAVLFLNPVTGEKSNIAGAGLWALLFGCFYFAYKGNWIHAFISGALAIGTTGISWLFYHFFAEKFMRAHYLSKGWRPVG